MRCKLSVNINKVALIRNSRGENLPNIINVSKDLIKFGAQGITVHPRPDERHIKYDDVIELKNKIGVELNVEGNPTKKFIDLVLKVCPAQVTLVPDSPDALTSNNGWKVKENKIFLEEICNEFKKKNIRTSIFVDPILKEIEEVSLIKANRIELYTGPYSKEFKINKENAIKDYINAAEFAKSLGLEINAGHDLNLYNLMYFAKNIPFISEVSIGHALICDALYYGFQTTIPLYLRQLDEHFWK